MIPKFRLKQQTIEAIDLTSAAIQALEIAAFAGAVNSMGFTIDITAGSVTFIGCLEGNAGDILVMPGQVISYNSSVISVQPREEFLALYEEQAG